jgi:hypothetical protein
MVREQSPQEQGTVAIVKEAKLTENSNHENRDSSEQPT